LASIQSLLGSYEVVTEDGKKLALAHPGSIIVPPRSSNSGAVSGSHG
jgi:hypothetical protein